MSNARENLLTGVLMLLGIIALTFMVRFVMEEPIITRPTANPDLVPYFSSEEDKEETMKYLQGLVEEIHGGPAYQNKEAGDH